MCSAESIAWFAVRGHSIHTHTPHTSQHHTHLHSWSHLDVMLTGGPVVFPGVYGGCPSPAPPPCSCCCPLVVVEAPQGQEGRGTARGHPQELDNRGAHNVVCMYCQWVVEGRGRGGGRNSRIFRKSTYRLLLWLIYVYNSEIQTLWFLNLLIRQVSKGIMVGSRLPAEPSTIYGGSNSSACSPKALICWW